MAKPTIIVQNSEQSVFSNTDLGVLKFDTEFEDIPSLAHNIRACLEHASKENFPEVSMVFYTGGYPRHAVDEIVGGVHTFLSKKPRYIDQKDNPRSR